MASVPTLTLLGLLVLIIQTTATKECHPGFKEGPGQSCYRAVFENKNWHDAQDKCKTLKSNLTSVTSWEELNFLWDNVVNETFYHYWIGLYKNITDVRPSALRNDWHWIDGTTYSTSWNIWKSNQPRLGDQHSTLYVSFTGDEPHWNGESTSDSRHVFICEQRLEAKKSQLTTTATTSASETAAASPVLSTLSTILTETASTAGQTDELYTKSMFTTTATEGEIYTTESMSATESMSTTESMSATMATEDELSSPTQSETTTSSADPPTMRKNGSIGAASSSAGGSSGLKIKKSQLTTTAATTTTSKTSTASPILSTLSTILTETASTAGQTDELYTKSMFTTTTTEGEISTADSMSTTESMSATMATEDELSSPTQSETTTSSADPPTMHKNVSIGAASSSAGASSGCFPGFKVGSDGQSCYRAFLNESKSWDDAQAMCKALNASLASVTSQKEMEFIWDHVITSASYYYWIGLYKNANSKVSTAGDDWQWIDGTIYNTNWTIWKAGQPKSNDQFATLYLSFTGEDPHWNGESTKATKHLFICKHGEHKTKLQG